MIKNKFLKVLSLLLTFILICSNINIPVSADWTISKTDTVTVKAAVDKTEQIQAVNAAFAEVTGKTYGKEKYDGIVSAKEAGLAEIADAETTEEANTAKESAIAAIHAAAAVTFNVPGEIAGYATVSFTDKGIRNDQDVTYKEALGSILPAASVPFVEGENIAEVTLRLLDAYGIDYEYTGNPQSGFYLAAIKDFYLADGTYIPVFGEFDSGSGSGWMVTWNNWFINMGASEFKVEANDIIRWQYTCQLGKDIGCDWSNQTAKITGIQIESAFSQYTGSEPADKDCITITVDKELTPEQVLAKELADARTTAEKQLDTYKDLKDFRTQQQNELTRIITAAKSDIMLAESVESVSSILEKTRLEMDRVKTDAELTEAENANLTDLLEGYIRGVILGRKTNDALTGTSILGSEQFTDENNGGNYAASSTWSDWLAMLMGRYSIVKSNGTIEFQYDDGTGYSEYLNALERYVDKTYAANDGKLHRVKATEWQRLIITISALGGDPTNFGTYNGKPINLVADGTYNCVISGGPSRQGINGIIFALISKNMYPNEQPETVLYSDSYLIQYLLERQLADGTDGAYGGWALTGTDSDPDITAMTIQALAPYYNSDTVYTYVNAKTGKTESKTIKQAVGEALNKLSAMQQSDGDFKSWGSTNVESTAQVLVALCVLGIDPAKDERFITAAGNTLLDGILKYKLDDGSFCHSYAQEGNNPSAGEGEYNYMATDQAGYALVAYWRFVNGMSPLYDMTADVTVTDTVLGDADGNGQVDLEDAQIVLKAALRIMILPEQQIALVDMDKSGSVDLADAQIVLKMALGIISE